jgi:hypothetical protein
VFSKFPGTWLERLMTENCVWLLLLKKLKEKLLVALQVLHGFLKLGFLELPRTQLAVWVATVAMGNGKPCLVESGTHLLRFFLFKLMVVHVLELHWLRVHMMVF